MSTACCLQATYAYAYAYGVRAGLPVIHYPGGTLLQKIF